jgi:hypothetical protein
LVAGKAEFPVGLTEFDKFCIEDKINVMIVPL